MCTIIVSFGNFYLDLLYSVHVVSHFSMGIHFDNNQLTLKLTWIGFSMGLSLACFQLYMGVVNSLLVLVPLTTLRFGLVLSKVVALVANLGKSQQYKLNEANLWGGRACVIVDGDLYSYWNCMYL